MVIPSNNNQDKLIFLTFKSYVMKLLYLTPFVLFATAYGQTNLEAANHDLIGPDNEETTVTNAYVSENVPVVSSIYPNPMTSSTRVSLENVSGILEVKLIDVYGQEVFSQETTLSYIELDQNKVSQGVYRMILVTNQGVYPQNQKLVVQ